MKKKMVRSVFCRSSCCRTALLCGALIGNAGTQILAAQRIVIAPARVERQRASTSIQHLHAASMMRGDVAVVLSEAPAQLAILSATAPERTIDLAGVGGLADPVSLSAHPDGSAVLLDRQPPRLIWLAINGDSARAVSMHAIPLSVASALCRLDSLTYVLGSVQPYNKSRLVHALDRDGRIVRSFGEPPGGGGPGVRIAYSHGALACLPDERLVVMAPRLFPEVQAYTAAGRLIWSRQIRPFLGIGVIEPSPGLIKYVYPPSGVSDEIASVFTPARHLVAVQVARHRSSTEPSRVVLTQLLSAVDGHVISEQRDLPLVLAASKTYLAVSDSPGAAVRLVSFRIAK